MSNEFDARLHFWAFQAGIVIIGVGWVCIDLLAGNIIASVLSFLLILANSVFALKAVSARERDSLGPDQRVVVLLIANLLSVFNVAGILVHFTALVQPFGDRMSTSMKRISYGGLLTSGLIFIFANHWPSPLYIRALIAISLILVTASLAIGLSGSKHVHGRKASADP